MSDRGTVTIESVFVPFLVAVVGVVTAVFVLVVVGVAGVEAAEVCSGGSMVDQAAFTPGT